jgi:hypothetical protein
MVASALSVLFFAASMYISVRRPISFDEILTEVVSCQSWPQGALQVLKTGVDEEPLPYYLLVKSSKQAFGRSGLALRLPSAIGLFFGLWLIFDRSPGSLMDCAAS